MRIAQVAPLYESVPPKQYGGTERVVSALSDELVALGHEVTLFASGDSETKARLVPAVDTSLRKRMSRDEMIQIAPLMHHRMLAELSAISTEFDVIHSHVDHLAFPYSTLWQSPGLHTLHGRLDLPFSAKIHSLYPNVPLASISDHQRLPLSELPLNWAATVYNGLDLNRYEFHPGDGSYLAFLGRISPEKRPDLAAEIAHRSGLPLRVAAKVDPADTDYWEQKIRPVFSRYDVDFIGEIGDDKKSTFLGGAMATLFPIDWPEPFGLVMIESMACGTPVIAARRGSVPEIIDEGIGGFILEDLDDMVDAVGQISTLDRQLCAKQAQRFSVSNMARSYSEVYGRLIADRSQIRSDAGVGLRRIAS